MFIDVRNPLPYRGKPLQTYMFRDSELLFWGSSCIHPCLGFGRRYAIPPSILAAIEAIC